jgi:acetylornithine/N-succinyldiaminopimelate aminotransferase
MGDALIAGLKKLQAQFPQHIAEIRGVGLMVGVLPTGDGRVIATKLLEAGLATAPSVSNVIRLVPPLNITHSHVAEALTTIEHVLHKLPA